MGSPSSDPSWWFQNPPSNELVWITVVLAIAGFIMSAAALPTVFQMFGGGPKVELSFDFLQDKDDMLRCSIGQPVVARWLRHLGVHRSPIAITVGFEIVRLRDRELIDGRALCFIRNVLTNETNRLMTLPESITPLLCVYLVGKVEGEEDFIVFTHADESENDKPIHLAPDTYEVTVHSIYAGHEMAEAKRRFVVTTDALEWVGA